MTTIMAGCLASLGPSVMTSSHCSSAQVETIMKAITKSVSPVGGSIYTWEMRLIWQHSHAQYQRLPRRTALHACQIHMCEGVSVDHLASVRYRWRELAVCGRRNTMTTLWEAPLLSPSTRTEIPFSVCNENVWKQFMTGCRNVALNYKNVIRNRCQTLVWQRYSE